MQTQPDVDLVTPSGATQTPLLRSDQLVVGAILTGPAWSTARRIEEIDGNTLVLVKIPSTPLSIQRGHLHTFTLHGGAECACGYRRETMVGVLPLRDGLARTYILAPTGPLLLPDTQTIYLGAGGRMISLGGALWSSSLPLIPLLEPIWTVPDELRALVEREG